MFVEFPVLLEAASAVLAVVALGYAILAVWAVSRPGWRRRPSGGKPSAAAGGGAYRPPLTVLKPLCGLEHSLYDNLRSFCEQDYPEYQVVFCIRRSTDPAVPVVQRVIRDLPGRDLALVVDERTIGTNLKVSNLVNAARVARHGILVMADSDMRVDSDYLQRVAEPFADPRVGAVTCPYRGDPAGGLASALGAAFINDWFLPSALVAVALGELRFCFGATMAVRRDVLERIGGLESLAAELADDYVLGKKVADHGFRVRLAPCVVENVVEEGGLRALFLHLLRWGRTVRAVRPLGYGFSFVTYTVPMVLPLMVATGFSGAGWGVLALALSLRMLLHYAVRGTAGVRGPSRPWLVPVGDVLGFVIWCASFMGQSVHWRNETFSVDSDGQLIAKGS